MQKIATDQLGLDYVEIRPRIACDDCSTWVEPSTPYVVIGPESTLQAKHWNNPEGWAKVAEFLRSRGLLVFNASKKDQKIYGVPFNGEMPFHDVVAMIKQCKLFIGLGSGLSWLAWALNKPVVMISGFSKPWTEFQCMRVHNEHVCNGCFNDHSCAFDRGDWNWCPRDKAFECTSSITVEQVIKTVSEFLEQDQPR